MLEVCEMFGGVGRFERGVQLKEKYRYRVQVIKKQRNQILSELFEWNSSGLRSKLTL